MTITKPAANRSILISGIVSIAMVLVGLFMPTGKEVARTWHAFLINYLYFTPAAAGMVVWPAIVIISNGRWMGSMEKICWTGISFSLPSVVALIFLWLSSKQWAPWIEASHHKLWLDNTFLFTRNLVLLILFWLMAWIFLTYRYSKTSTTLSGWLILAYVITFSLSGFDFVMTLEPGWYSMMIGGYFFISSLYIAVTAWAFLSVLLVKPIEKNALHDIGRLMLTFCMLTSYLMFSQLLPIWYENLPEETTFLIPRMNPPWKLISYILLGIIYLGPVLLLLNRWAKENISYMGIISLLILTGMWMERWWLVSAVFEKNQIQFGWPELVPTVAFLGIIATGIILTAFLLPEHKIKQPEK